MRQGSELNLKGGGIASVSEYLPRDLDWKADHNLHQQSEFKGASLRHKVPRMCEKRVR